MLVYFNQKARPRCILCVSCFLLNARIVKSRDVTTLTVFRRGTPHDQPMHAPTFICNENTCHGLTVTGQRGNMKEC